MRNLNKSPVLLNTVDVSSIESTITRKGNRNPYSSGIFLSQIHSSQSPEKSGELSYIEFAVRLRDRNKPSNRTNKIRSFRGVVDTVSHPIKGDTSQNTKHGNPQMKIYPQSHRSLAALSPIVFTLTQGGLANA